MVVLWPARGGGRSLVPLLALALALPLSASAQPLRAAWVSPHPERLGAFGRATAGVPDADGDGRGDLLVGAPSEAGSDVDGAGRAYLFSGHDGSLLHTLASPNARSGGEFGASVAATEDTDGDGRGDLLIGAPREEVGAHSGAGRAYLFSGATGAVLLTLESPLPQGGGRFGGAVARVPDADGDGVEDLLVGADHEDGGDVGSGRAHLFSGASGAWLATLASPNPQVAGAFGEAVAGVPDVDGDGRGDLLVGAWFERVDGRDEAGRAYLFSGARGALLRTLESPNADWRGDFGRSVAGLPDVDRDGAGDLLIGAPGEDVEGHIAAGRAYLFSGADGALLHPLEAPTPAEGERYGSTVAAAPDADGDGVGDLLLGSRERVGGESGAGRVAVASGTSGARLLTLVSPNAERSGYFGDSVAGVPDADGRGDLLVGAWGEDAEGLTNAGRVYLFSGARPLVDLRAEPTSSRTVAPGGTVSFDYTLTNTSADAITGALRAGVRDARGDSLYSFGPVVRGTLDGGEPYADALVQPVPPEAPPAAYTYVLAAVASTGEVLDEEVFTITVTPSARHGGPPVPWPDPHVGEPLAPPPIRADGEAVAVAVSPNPFRARTTVRVRLDAPAQVRLVVYDLLGREAGAHTFGRLAAGAHALPFDGRALPAGVYLWRLVADGQGRSGRMTRLP